MLKQTISVIFLCLFIVSCDSQKERHEQRDPLQDAYRMIDRNEPSAAIDYLQALQKKDHRSEVKMALASAYAARGGIRVEDYWGFAIGFKAPVLNIDKIEATPEMDRLRKILNQMNGQLDSAQMNSLGGLVRALAAFEIYKERIHSIPTIDQDKRADVIQAISVLNEVPTRGGKLYRSILQLMIIKTQLSEGFQSWDLIQRQAEQLQLHNLAIEGPKLLCRIDIDAYRRWLNSIVTNIQNLALDLSVAFPSRQNEFESSVVEVKKAVNLTATSWGQECP